MGVKLPADVQSFPGVSGNSRNFPSTKHNSRGVEEVFSRRLSESVLDDGHQLLPAVRREVEQQGATFGTSLEPWQDTVREV